MSLFKSDYLHNALYISKRKIIINKAIKHIKTYISKNKLKDFDTIAITGLSGALIGIPVADALKKRLVILRKTKTPNCHSYHEVEGYCNPKKYIIIDDLISTGETIERIIKKCGDKKSPKFVYLYDYSDLNNGHNIKYKFPILFGNGYYYNRGLKRRI